MTDTFDTSRDWLRKQLEAMRTWRCAINEAHAPDPGLAEKIADHEAWLEDWLDRLDRKAA